MGGHPAHQCQRFLLGLRTQQGDEQAAVGVAVLVSLIEAFQNAGNQLLVRECFPVRGIGDYFGVHDVLRSGVACIVVCQTLDILGISDQRTNPIQSIEEIGQTGKGKEFIGRLGQRRLCFSASS